MKRVLTLFAVAVAFFFMMKPASLLAEPVNLYEELARRSEVKVFVSDPVDSSGTNVALPGDLKLRLEEALAARKSIHFQIVQTREEADLAIDAIILEFIWAEKDPVDMLMGVGMTAMDVLTDDNYVRMQAHFVVTDTHKKQIVWQDKLFSTVTKSPMSQEEAAKLINPDMAKTFIRQAFAKRR